MNNENLKRLKINEPDVFKMDVDSQAIVLTVIPFLTDYELVNYLATNREMQSYDNDRLWNRIKPKWTRISKRCTKKCIHFERLAYRYTLPQLIDECTNTYQIGLLRLYVNMTTPRGNTRETIKQMICLLTPKFLKKQLVWRPHYTHWPSNQSHKEKMVNESLRSLRQYLEHVQKLL